MSKTPFISHTINGYSRYDIPESVAFSASAGILYPIRVDFMNARDVRYIQCGSMIRTNPALVPTFTPFRCSLHRFFVPMQLYHPEMRVNASNFSMSDLSTNVIPVGLFSTRNPSSANGVVGEDIVFAKGRSLLSFLGLFSGLRPGVGSTSAFDSYPYVSQLSLGREYVNADPVLAYYDIVRSYYSFSQLNSISFAFPHEPTRFDTPYTIPIPAFEGNVPEPGDAYNFLSFGTTSDYWCQSIGSLSQLDDLFEMSFYPRRGDAAGLYYNRLPQICDAIAGSVKRVTPSRSPYDESVNQAWYNTFYSLQGISAIGDGVTQFPCSTYWATILPYGVAPAVADRFSRLLSASASPDVSLTNVSTVRGLAFASKMQAYRDLLSSGGSRFSDWLMTFFAAKIDHVDRPILLYSSSFYMNSNPIFSQQGGDDLGSYAGVIQGQDSFGKKAQRYSFDEPGYLIDIFCIRPLYYWAGIQRDYARYDKMDYFNPIFNEVGYQDVPGVIFGINRYPAGDTKSFREPCYNEFRSSFDRVLGDLALVPGYSYTSRPVLASWVQQRANVNIGNSDSPNAGDSYFDSIRFTDIGQSNSVFASNSEDNFFVNVYYNVVSKTLVSKNFATNLATR